MTNVSDEPSRVDLSQHRYVLLESASFAGDVGVHLGALSSAPVPCAFAAPFHAARILFL